MNLTINKHKLYYTTTGNPANVDELRPGVKVHGVLDDVATVAQVRRVGECLIADFRHPLVSDSAILSLRIDPHEEPSPSYDTSTCVTGRTSASKPNIATVPSTGEIYDLKSTPINVQSTVRASGLKTSTIRAEHLETGDRVLLSPRRCGHVTVLTVDSVEVSLDAEHVPELVTFTCVDAYGQRELAPGDVVSIVDSFDELRAERVELRSLLRECTRALRAARRDLAPEPSTPEPCETEWREVKAGHVRAGDVLLYCTRDCVVENATREKQGTFDTVQLTLRMGGTCTQMTMSPECMCYVQPGPTAHEAIVKLFSLDRDKASNGAWADELCVILGFNKDALRNAARKAPAWGDEEGS